MSDLQLPLSATRPGQWLIAVPIADVDEAWDAAKDVATETWGLSSGFVDLYSDSFSRANSPVPAGALLRQFHQGQFDASTSALAVASDRDWKRARFVFRSTDTSLRFATQDSEFDSLDVALENMITTSLEPTDASRFVEAVHVSGLKRRYKITRVRNVGASAKRFVLLGQAAGHVDGPLVVLGYAPSQAEARALAKQLADAGHDIVDLFALSGREGDLPLVRTARELVTQRFTARGTTLTQKSEKNRLAGWVFTGPLASGEEPSRPSESDNADGDLDEAVADND